MNIKERTQDSVTILSLSGKIVLGEGDGQMRMHVCDLLANGRKSILLNLAEISYVDSAGLGALISCHTTAQREGGRLKLVSLTRKMQDLLVITKLITVFETYETEEEALRSFN